MTIKRLPLVNGASIDISFGSDDLRNHAADARNHVDAIIDQLAHEYGVLFRRPNLSTVLDVGANIGLFSIYMSPICGHIYAIEPTPSHFALLQEVTADFPNIQPINMALSNSVGDVDFFISRENSTMNTLVQQINEVYDRSVRIPACDIEHMLNHLDLDHVDLVKLDIEGSESVCITPDLVKAVRDRVDCWFVECHGNPVGGSWQQVFHNTRDVFDKCGYAVYHVTHDGIMAQPRSWPSPPLYTETDAGRLSGEITLQI